MSGFEKVESNTELKRISHNKLYDHCEMNLPYGINNELKELRKGTHLYKHDLTQPNMATKAEYKIFH